MNKTKRSWDVLSPEQRQKAIQDIINYFSTERDESIGAIAATELLDMFLMSAGIAAYNNGADASKKTFQDHLDQANTEIEITIKKEGSQI